MESVILVIHLILALAIIGLVLLQRSEGGGLGIGGSQGGGLGGLASAKGTANALTKMTGFCAAGFFLTSLTLGVLAGSHSKANQDILKDVDITEVEAPVIDDVSAPSGVTYTPPVQDSVPEATVEVEAPVATETPVTEVEAPVVDEALPAETAVGPDFESVL